MAKNGWKEIADTWDQKSPGEKLFFESIATGMGEWAIREYFKSTHEIKEYFYTETFTVPIGVSHGLVKYKEHTVLSLKQDPRYKMTLENFQEVAAELAKLGVDITACMIQQLKKHWDERWGKDNQLTMDLWQQA